MKLFRAIPLALLCACGGCRKVPVEPATQSDAAPCLLVESGSGGVRARRR